MSPNKLSSRRKLIPREINEKKMELAIDGQRCKGV